MQVPPHPTSDSLPEGTCWSGCCPLFPENQAAPRRLSCCLPRGSTSALSRAMGDCAAWGRGPQRIRQNNLQVARTRSKTAFFPTAQGAFAQTLGNTLTWISDQRCLQTPWPHKSPVCSDQSHQEGSQAERADFWRTNRDSCITQTPTWESPPRRPEAGPQRHPEPQWR